MRVYRAAESNDAYQGSSFALDFEAAKAYTSNPGFGGPDIFAVEVEGGVLDLVEGGLEPPRPGAGRRRE